MVFERVKTVEMKESLDQLVVDGSKDGQIIKTLLRAAGEASFTSYHRPVSKLVELLQSVVRHLKG